MTVPYTYTDRDGIPLRITPLPQDDGPGARLALREPTVHVDAADAPRVCREILCVAGRTDVALVCSECRLAPEDAESGPDGRCRHTHATRIHRRLDPPTSHVPDTSGSASGSQPETDWARLALALIRGEGDPADVDPTDPGAWEVACASLYGDQGLLARMRDERDQARAEADRLRDWSTHYRAQRDAARAGDSDPVEDAAAAYRRGAEDMRERAAACSESWHGQAMPRTVATKIRALELPDGPPEFGRDYADESAEPGDEVPTLAELTDRVDAVEDHSDRIGYRIDGLSHEYTRCSELLRTLAAEVMPDDSPTLSARVAVLEHTIRLATTTGEVRTAEDNLGGLDRRTRARLDALETRMLATEQGGSRPAADCEDVDAQLHDTFLGGGT